MRALDELFLLIRKVKPGDRLPETDWPVEDSRSRSRVKAGTGCWGSCEEET